MRCFKRYEWKLGSFAMKISKWTPNFDPRYESPLLPICVAIKNLPIHLHDSKSLLDIAQVFGKPIKLDATTENFGRPSLARVCVEVDISLPQITKFCVQNGDIPLFLNAYYENVPHFCHECRGVGRHNLGCNLFPSPTPLNQASVQKKPAPSPKNPAPVPKNPAPVSKNSAHPPDRNFLPEKTAERFHYKAINKVTTGGSSQDGKWTSTQEETQLIFYNHFQNLYQHVPTMPNDTFINNVPTLITPEDNFLLSKLPQEDEVKAAVWSLNSDSAAGPDGYNGHFYKHCWKWIREDVTKATQEFFLGIKMPKQMALSTIILIPKKENPSHCEDFRPICLSNFAAKIIPKIIATRLGIILPKLISMEQGGFVKGRSINEQVLIAHEMIHGINHNTRGVMDRFGFDKKFQSLIHNTLQATLLSISLNGHSTKPFKTGRGLKQGDPLSPLLFILAAEGFSRTLNSHMNSGKLEPYRMGRNHMHIHHLAYAEDLIVFLNGGKQNLTRFTNFLKSYEETSGQMVNLQKCNFYNPCLVKTQLGIHFTNATSARRFGIILRNYLESTEV
ncbi:unnamed protein product [Cuscuta campestris]|uniref:Reverse transcriptase domain-containing protein n=1 Tax=Cuscuta campestris TaxID=132261 RepID=A0A484MNU7_9ASTE|nr:unnamed protein product [Cuscuta campestris]